jgi:hypothetical protein
MWPYLTAPLLVLLPERWRHRVTFEAPMPWRVASALCGLGQIVTGFFALVWWYSYSVDNWAGRVMNHAIETQSAISGMKPHQLGAMALIVVVTNPVTWLILIWSIEGIVRVLAAAITAEVFGTLPLALLAEIIGMFQPARTSNPGLTRPAKDASLDESPAHSFASFLRRSVIERTNAHVPDHVTHLKDAEGELLKISASHTKPDWNPGRIICIAAIDCDEFYHIDSFTERREDPGRPFVYILRRLAAGIRTPNMLVYAPPELEFVPR